MDARAPAPLPPALLGLGRRVLRPRDARGHYVNPSGEFQRIASTGALRPLAHGYYLVPPQEALALPGWRPPVEHVALGVAVADHGERAALMGLSAARYHGAFPRAHATAWVAVPVNRRPLELGEYGRIVFVQRDLDRLDLVRARTTLADGWVTSAEQTLLDLARRPDHGGGADIAAEAVQRLWRGADHELLEGLAAAQRGRRALARARAMAGAVDDR